MLRHLLLVILSLSTFTAAAVADAPKVIKASPDNGETSVDTATREIRIEFDQPMNPKSWSWVGGGG